MPFVAICEACESAYPAELTEDGTLHLLGGRSECACGCSSFRLRGADSPDGPDSTG